MESKVSREKTTINPVKNSPQHTIKTHYEVKKMLGCCKISGWQMTLPGPQDRMSMVCVSGNESGSISETLFSSV